MGDLKLRQILEELDDNFDEGLTIGELLRKSANKKAILRAIEGNLVSMPLLDKRLFDNIWKKFEIGDIKEEGLFAQANSLRLAISSNGYALLNQMRTRVSIDTLDHSIKKFNQSSDTSLERLDTSIKNFDESSKAYSKKLVRYNIWLICFTAVVIFVAVVSLWVSGMIGLAQVKLAASQTRLANQSYIQGEPNIVPTGYCEYVWYADAGYNQSFSLVNIGKSPGTAILSYNSTHFSPFLYQNSSVGFYGNNTTIQVLPGIPSTFKVQGNPKISEGNMSRLNYSIRIKTNGGTFGDYFNSCYVLTCSYINDTPTRYAIGNNIAYIQVKANTINANYPHGFSGLNTSANTTWRQVPLAACT